jgi:hypothetical protein
MVVYFSAIAAGCAGLCNRSATRIEDRLKVCDEEISAGDCQGKQERCLILFLVASLRIIVEGLVR